MLKKIFNNTAAQIFLLALLATVTVAGWRVNFFKICNGAETVFYSAVPNGCKFTTGYIHSVEKTAVVDEYIIADGKIWSWQEIVSSSNAGMPSVLPKYMHFSKEKDKLIFRSGRISPENIYLRIGNETFGKNFAQLMPFEKICLYRALPGKRLRLSVQKDTLLFNNEIRKFPFTVWH